MEEAAEKKNHNLFLLGVFATLLAVVTTGISVLIYHYSGDIYLDRSRPGYLPDKAEIEETMIEEFDFSEDGPITKYDLDEYLKHYQIELNELDELKSPYSAEPLSDDALGIPAAKKPEPVPTSEDVEAEEY